MQKIALLEYVLFAVYLVLFAWLVTKVGFFIRSGLSASQLIIFFLLKVLAGIFYGWIGVYYGELAQMVDTWAYHYESLNEYRLLVNEPSVFFLNLLGTTYESGYAGFFASQDSWWNDLKGNALLKLLAVFNVFSLGNYYVNVIFYSFLTLFGPIAFYRIMKNIYPSRQLSVLLATFLVPSFLYWTSGIHKDGFIFLGLAIVLYHFYFALQEKKLLWYRPLYILLGLLIILVLRNFLIVVIIPALIAWLISAKSRSHAIRVFVGIYLFFAVLFFSAKYISPSLDFPVAVAAKQQDFLKMIGGSAVDVDVLEPSVYGFITNAPQAFALSVVRPYPTDVRHLLSLAAALEINLLLLLFFCFLIWRKKITSFNAFLFFCVLLSFSILMMIGYTVNFLGAIVRYRSIVLPLLLVPMVAQVDWAKIRNLMGKIV